MSPNSDTIDRMNVFAAEAAKSYPKNGSAEDVARWFQKWYMQAGYKRLAKVMLAAHGIKTYASGE